MKFLLRLKEERAVVFSALISLLALIVMILGGVVAGLLIPVVGDDYYTALLIQEGVTLVFLFWLLWATKLGFVLTRRGAGLLHAVQVAAYPLSLIALVAMTMGMLGAESGAALQSPMQIAIYFLSMLSIGLVEEITFRGIVAEALIHRYGTSRAGVWKATAVGGLIFGLAHMSNVFAANPFGVLIQVAVAGVLGMLFAAIYYRTGNLWICVLLHAGLDAASLLESGLYGAGTISDMVSSFSLMNLTPCLTYGLPILFLLRRKKLKEVQLWFGQAKD
ncbi:MAG: CPBP family intramembrane glutamic endopeptidase [Faecalibacterium sp.]